VVDGIIYGTFAGLGFAAVENVGYYFRFREDMGLIFLVRGVLSPWLHPLFTSMTGLGFGLAREVGTTWAKATHGRGFPARWHSTASSRGFCCRRHRPGWSNSSSPWDTRALAWRRSVAEKACLRPWTLSVPAERRGFSPGRRLLSAPCGAPGLQPGVAGSLDAQYRPVAALPRLAVRARLW
jgi:hypothetical protein